jgi:hypothetical protein
LIVFVLEVSRGEVVYTRVAKDVGTHVFCFVELVASLADYHAEFSLIVGAGGDTGPAYRSAGLIQRTGGLEEQQRLRGHFVSEFRSMFSIISADANDFCGSDWSE